MSLPRLLILSLTVAVVGTFVTSGAGVLMHAETKRPWLVAHRGASAYAPENTVPAFVLAAEQGATFVEYDLQPTKDGVLICLHDDTLDRTTDVEEVFPDRFREVKSVKHWYAEDFTFAELQKLDAGSWFGEKFKGTRIPSHQQAIEALRGRSGLFIELKSPEKFAEKGFDIEGTTLADLKKQGLDKPGADPKTPVVIQSFTHSSIEKLALTLKTPLPLHFLFSKRDSAKWTTMEALKGVRKIATGISPEKDVLLDNPKTAEMARDAGLAVTPYTFRASAVKGFPDVTAEMTHYLKAFAVDGVITDNPDQMPKQ